MLADCRGLANQTCDVYGTHNYRALDDYTITISHTTPVCGLTYQAADALGNVGSCTAIVAGPHDQRR